MKKIFIVVASICFTVSLQAQKKTNKFNNVRIDTTALNEIEVDVTNIIKTAFITSDFYSSQINISSPYVFTYRRYFKNFDFHTGFGISGAKRESKDQFTNEINNESNLQFNYGLGFSHYYAINKRLELFYGSDILFNLSKRKYERDGEYSIEGKFRYTSEDNSLGGGIRPFLGIQFYLSPKISLSTETALYVLYEKGKYSRVTDFIGPTEDIEYNDNYNQLSTRYLVPLNIKLRIRF